MVRETGRDQDTLETWNEQLVMVGSRLLEKRLAWVAELSGYAERIHAEIAGQAETLRLQYLPSVPLDAGDGIEAAFRATLQSLRRDEVARGVTLAGPHRDDLSFLINGADARVFASQGQQRSVALATKLAEVELMRERIGEPPVLLLDDAGAELDEARRRRLFSLVTGGYQTLVACTDPTLLPQEILSQARLYHVEKGAVSRCESADAR